MHLLNVEDVHKSYGVRPLLDGVSLGIDTGERIGVVGLNGGGKTTLLEVLAGVEPVDDGRISRARGMRLAVVTQRTTLPRGVTIADVVLADFAAEHEWAADARVRSIVTGLGLVDLGLSCDVDTLSGGERRRVALAAALVQDLDLLVLDEPTNHLDVEGVRWLADHLLRRRCSCVVVTHDRWFLDTVCTRTWEVTEGRVESYEGGYSDWIYARAERARLSAQAEEKRRNLARKELAWLQRGAKARTSKPKYRIEAAEALISDVPEPRDSVELVTFAKRRLGKTVVELEDLTLWLGRTTLLDDVTWRVGPGDRIGLVGVNGSGKTTLLRLLAGEVAERERAEGDDARFTGRRIEGKTVRLAHLTQELSDLPTASRVLEAVEEIALRVTLGKYELTASQLCERFGFGKSRQWTPVSELSGGERRRLQLARLLMGEPNVLLLDEPTNDLDIDTLQQLEDLLDSWPGTLVVVSHDRYLVERVCDSVVALFGDGGITDLPGGIDEYLSRRKKAEEAGESGTPAGRAAGSEPAPSRPADTRTSAAEQRAAQKTIARVERRMRTIDTKESSLHEAMAAAGGDTERLRELDGELTALREEKERLEAEWLDAVDTTG